MSAHKSWFLKLLKKR